MNADKDTTETYKLNELVDNKNVDIADNQHQNNPEGVSDEPGSSQDKTQNVQCSSQDMEKTRLSKQAVYVVVSGLKVIADSSTRHHQILMKAE